MRNRILIYCDYGTSDITNLRRSLTEYFSPKGISVGLTDAKGIVNENDLNKDVLAFFMPGGRATPYLEKLRVQGNKKIAEYVNNGGIYFGICAGAYYAGRQVLFETDIKELSIVQQCELNLINAETVGTLYKELNISPYTTDFSSTAAAEVRWLADGEKHFARYHGGPYFKPLEQNDVEVLAEYIVEGKSLPAVVMQRQGKGFAIASGVHIEDSSSDLRQILPYLRANREPAQKVISQLEQNEPSRQALFVKLMNKLNIRN